MHDSLAVHRTNRYHHQIPPGVQCGHTVLQQIVFAWRLRRVWWFTATARTTARFARTKLGSIWLGLTTTLTIALLTFVYSRVFNINAFHDYAVYLGVGLVLWNSVAGAIGSSPRLFEQNRHGLNNINIPPIFYVLEEWAFQLQTLFQVLLTVLLCLSVFQPRLLLHLASVGVPGLVNLFLYLFWAPLIVCLLGARYNDFYQLVPVALQLVFLLSPILYEKSALGSYAWFTYLNPIYPVISLLRDSLITGHLKVLPSTIFFLFNLIACYGSLRLLRRESQLLPFLF